MDFGNYMALYGDIPKRVQRITHLEELKSHTEGLSESDKKELLALICEKQIGLIMDNHENYDSSNYQKLEELKIKIKDLE